MRKSSRISVLSFFFLTASFFCATALEQPLDLLSDVTWLFSSDGGESFTEEPPIVPAMPYRCTFPIIARAVFKLSEALAADQKLDLEIYTGIPFLWRPEYELNAHGFTPILKDMLSNLPVDRRFLKEGKNTLVVRFAARNDRTNYKGEKKAAAPFAIDARKWRLLALPAVVPSILNGPVIGAVQDDSFRLACQLNRIAEVRVFDLDSESIDPVAFSKAGIFHNPKIPFKHSGLPFNYKIVVGSGEDISEIEGRVTPFSLSSTNLRFAVCSDSQMSESRPDLTRGRWGEICEAIINREPDLVAFCGDLVCGANTDEQWFGFWNEHFFVPARKMLASIPFYTVQGNHDYAPIAGKLFPTPPLPYRLDGSYLIPHWAQRIGQTLMIGIEGGQNWAPDACHYQWLEETLAAAHDADFIFLFTHYAPWTSGAHGKLGADGRPVEGPMRQAKEYILPLLQKYGVTALLAGHDHFYERSEPAGGVSVIISAGAGGRISKKYSEAEKQNPHSVLQASVLNFSLFEINGKVCSFTAFNVDTGEIIDEREWKARTGK